MILQGQVGPQTLSDGSFNTIRAGKAGEASVSELQPRYYEQVYRGNVFNAASQATTTPSGAGLITTSVFAVANPAGSGKNMALIQLDYAACGTSTVLSQAVFGFQAFSNTAITSSTAITIRNCLIGNGTTSIATAISSGNLVTAPIVIKPIYATQEVTTVAGYALGTPISIDLGGSFILTPGTAVAVQQITGITAFMAGLTWLEYPV